MSEEIVQRGPDGEALGILHVMDVRRPTKKSSGAHLAPNGSEGPLLLVVRCRKRPLLTLYGDREPLTVLGAFAADHLLLQGETVIASRPDLQLARLMTGQDPRSTPVVVADAARPLQLWCPNHPAGHDIDPVLLRTETRAARRTGKEKSCPVERVAVNG